MIPDALEQFVLHGFILGDILRSNNGMKPSAGPSAEHADLRVAVPNPRIQDVRLTGVAMKYCNHCGGRLEVRVPEGDNRSRFVCTNCAAVLYQNPRIVAGCVPVWQDQVLLCRRAIEPRKGFWTLPAGFMENAETMAEAASRETLEEACARVENLELYTLFDLPHINQVYIFFRSQLVDLNYSAGTESLEVKLFDEADIPWSELAFPTVGRTLEYFFADRQQGIFPVRNDPVAPMVTKPFTRP
jgi:ADP-ribose pyrophosphatase YjhB (NUDIX family)